MEVVDFDAARAARVGGGTALTLAVVKVWWRSPLMLTHAAMRERESHGPVTTEAEADGDELE